MIDIFGPLFVSIVCAMAAVYSFNRENNMWGWLNIIFSALNFANFAIALTA